MHQPIFTVKYRGHDKTLIWVFLKKIKETILFELYTIFIA